MIQINLLPDVKSEHIKAVRQKQMITTIALVTSGVFLAVVILLALTVFVVQKNRISSLSDSIEDKIGKLKSVEDLDKTLTIQNQLSEIPELYDKKPNVNNLFNFLSVLTPEKEIELTSTQAVLGAVSAESTTAANMEISGTTATLKNVNKFADTIKNAKYSVVDPETGEKKEGLAFSSVVIESVSKDAAAEDPNEAVKFTIVLSYNPDIYNIKYDSVTLTVPNIESSVSSTEKPNFNPKPFDEEGGE